MCVCRLCFVCVCNINNGISGHHNSSGNSVSGYNSTNNTVSGHHNSTDNCVSGFHLSHFCNSNYTIFHRNCTNEYRNTYDHLEWKQPRFRRWRRRLGRWRSGGKHELFCFVCAVGAALHSCGCIHFCFYGCVEEGNCRIPLMLF